jgi:hypothetical protein
VGNASCTLTGIDESLLTTTDKAFIAFKDSAKYAFSIVYKSLRVSSCNF